MPRITFRLGDEIDTELRRLLKNIRRDNPRMDVTVSDIIRAALLAYIQQWKFISWAQGNYKLRPRPKRGPPEAGK
ncbi:hypothetical protein G7K71_04865 [Desulfofundulus sp. TPOSR]|uniref:hypothetical protein n=1 Tax=Desulfofundulus sp. TPOSR TaxID=2714340 RepID=UPI0014082F07|nr:hypothetical protein [Desulfofundulus sp. TPOSR]NHM26334.1 hypothetical protein [Desulfofundulus sp. TPOSR]